MLYLRLRVFWLLVACSLPTWVSGQQNRARYDAVSQQLLAAFNTGEPSAMYALTAPAYQARMSAAAFATGTRKFQVQTGAWESEQFRETVENGLTYTARFERETEILFLQLDEQGRIVRFNFKAVPFAKTTKADRVPTDNPLATSTDSAVERLVRPYIQQGHTAGLCLAVIERGTVRRYRYGEVQRGSGRLPDPATTIFEIGSVTKTFTALLLARQVVRRRMRLADPVSWYLPASIPPLAYQGTPLTLVSLANHTSGLPRLPANLYLGPVDPADPYRHYGPDSLFQFLARYRPAAPAGQRFAYSNLGAGLLGTVLARQADQSFGQLVRRRICRPLGLHNTYLDLPTAALAHAAQGYTEKGEPTAVWHLAALEGSGALKSTLNDMVRYTQAHLGQVHTSLASAIALTHQETFRSPDNTLGLGWRITWYRSQPYWHHSGGTGGARSFVGFDTQRQLGVVVLSNAADDVTAIGQALLER